MGVLKLAVEILEAAVYGLTIVVGGAGIALAITIALLAAGVGL